MYDAFGSAGGMSRRRQFKGRLARGEISPSFGERQGILEAKNPSDRRRFPRVAHAFVVRTAEGRIQVEGDLSAGGAMFALPEALPHDTVEVLVVDGGLEKRAKGRVLRVEAQGDRVMHHVQFTDWAPFESFVQRLQA